MSPVGRSQAGSAAAPTATSGSLGAATAHRIGSGSSQAHPRPDRAWGGVSVEALRVHIVRPERQQVLPII